MSLSTIGVDDVGAPILFVFVHGWVGEYLAYRR